MEKILAVPTFVVKVPLKLDIIQFSRTGRKSFLYAKIDYSNHLDLRHLETLGFRVIETNVTLKQKSGLEFKIGSHQNPQYRIRLAQVGDRKDVEEIARKSFNLDRFHQDPKIDNFSADEIKKQWASNFFAGKRGDVLIVASRNNRTIAFLLLIFGKKENIIDLIAVDPEHRKNGLAEKMIHFAKSINGSQKKLFVGTQVSNTPSIRLYEKLGFNKINSQNVLHYHGPFKNSDS